MRYVLYIVRHSPRGMPSRGGKEKTRERKLPPTQQSGLSLDRICAGLKPYETAPTAMRT